MNVNASLFLQMVVFFIGAWITMKYIWPPVIHAIEERQKKIADGLAAANKGEKALAVATEQRKAIEAEARSTAATIVSNGEKRAEKIIDDAKAQALVEAERIIESARAEAEQEMQSVRDALRNEVANLAIAGAEQILAREIDKTVHAQLLEQLRAKL